MELALSDSLHHIANGLVKNFKNLKLADPTVRAVRLVPAVPEGYIWPNAISAQLVDSPRVMLVIAAGAVGKSMAAEALAASLGWPLVDAARAQVGSYSLTGALQDALGLDSTYVQEIATGRAGVVVDALDEGHLRAGTSNFQEFLDNVRRLAGAESNQPGIVLFSRPDTAEIIQTYMTDSQTAMTVLQLDFFTYSQACDYLESRLADLDNKYPNRSYGIARRHPSSYAALRDLRLGEIATALLGRVVGNLADDWTEVAEFLGYAPVLSVLAEYLAVANPSVAVARPATQRLEPTIILLQIIDSILEREQAKFKDQVCTKLLAQLPADLEWPQIEHVYSKEEQSVRLVSRYFSLQVTIQVPAMLPAAARQQYELDADQFTADHPFLSGSNAVNTVFNDFMLAKAAVDATCQLAFADTAGVLNRAPGPFFYRFVHAFAPRPHQFDEETPFPEIPERLIGPLIESQSRSQIDLTNSFFVVVLGNGGGALLIGRASNDPDAPDLEFEVTDPSGILVFPTRLSRGIIITDGGVVLGTRGERFYLGPNVRITAPEIDIEADYLSVECGSKELPAAPCTLVSPEVRVVSNTRVDISRPNALSIVGGATWPALRPFVVASQTRFDVVTSANYVDLRAIMRTFRQQAGNRPSVFKDLLEQRVVGSSKSRASFLNSLREMSIVEQASDHYYLNTKSLAARGINLSGLINGQPTEPVLDFLLELSKKIPD